MGNNNPSSRHAGLQHTPYVTLTFKWLIITHLKAASLRYLPLVRSLDRHAPFELHGLRQSISPGHNSQLWSNSTSLQFWHKIARKLSQGSTTNQLTHSLHSVLLLTLGSLAMTTCLFKVTSYTSSLFFQNCNEVLRLSSNDKEVPTFTTCFAVQHLASDG